MFTFLIFNLLKNNLINLLPKVKNMVMNKVIRSTGAFIVIKNDAIVTLLSVSEKSN